MKISKRHINKRRTFKKVIGMHKILRQNYSDTKTYTIGQVKTVFNQIKMDPKFLEYAYALYVSKIDFESVALSTNYDDLREKISNIYFKGDSELVGTEGITYDFEKLNRYPQQWHYEGTATGGGS